MSAGLALTSGNTDTSTVNAAYDLVYNPQTKNVVKSDALLLRGKTEGVVSANRFGFNVRDEYSLTPRTFVFGQNTFLKDGFKSIDYLVAPTAGLGYKLFDTKATKHSVDGSSGGVWEKNPRLRRVVLGGRDPWRETDSDGHGDNDDHPVDCRIVEDQELR